MADDSFKRFIEEKMRENSFLEEVPNLPTNPLSLNYDQKFDEPSFARPPRGIGEDNRNFNLYHNNVMHAKSRDQRGGEPFIDGNLNTNHNNGMCIPAFLNGQMHPGFMQNSPVAFPQRNRSQTTNNISSDFSIHLPQFRDDSQVDVISNSRYNDLKDLDLRSIFGDVRKSSKDDSFLSVGSGSNISLGKIIGSGNYFDQFYDSAMTGFGLPNDKNNISPKGLDSWKFKDPFDNPLIPADPVLLKPKNRIDRQPEIQHQTNQMAMPNGPIPEPISVANCFNISNLGINTQGTSSSPDLSAYGDHNRIDTPDSCMNGGGIFTRLVRKASGIRNREIFKHNSHESKNHMPVRKNTLSWSNKKRTASVSNLNTGGSQAPSMFASNAGKTLQDVPMNKSSSMPSMPANHNIHRSFTSPLFGSSNMFPWNRSKTNTPAPTRAPFHEVPISESNPVMQTNSFGAIQQNMINPEYMIDSSQNVCNKNQIGHLGWNDLHRFLPRLERMSPRPNNLNSGINNGIYISNEQPHQSPYPNIIPNRQSSLQRFVQPKRMKTDMPFAPMPQQPTSAKNLSLEPTKKQENPVTPQVSSARRGAAARRPRFKGRFMRTSNVWTSITELQRPKKESAAVKTQE